MDQDQSSNQGETTAKVEDKGKIDKLEKELDVIGEKAQKEIADKPPIQPKTVPVESQQPQTQNAPASQPTQQPITPPPGAKPGGMNKVLKIALIFLVFSVFVAVIYFGKDYFLQLKTKSTPTPVPTSTATPDPTADWETYEENIFGYQIKHPSNWGTKVLGTSGETLIIAPQEIIDTIPDDDFGGGSFLTMSINSSSNLFDTPEVSSSQDVATNSSVLVGGVDGSHYTIEILEEGPGFEIGDVIETVILSKGGTYYKIDLLDDGYNEIFFQILSTFEFIEATPSASPTSSPSATPTATP